MLIYPQQLKRYTIRMKKAFQISGSYEPYLVFYSFPFLGEIVRGTTEDSTLQANQFLFHKDGFLRTASKLRSHSLIVYSRRQKKVLSLLFFLFLKNERTFVCRLPVIVPGPFDEGRLYNNYSMSPSWI